MNFTVYWPGIQTKKWKRVELISMKLVILLAERNKGHHRARIIGRMKSTIKGGNSLSANRCNGRWDCPVVVIGEVRTRANRFTNQV